MTRYQAVTLSTHCTLYKQQICAIFFLFSALEAEIMLSFGHSWPFFFLLKRLYNTITIKAEAHDALLIIVIKERTTITVGVTADSAVTPTVIVALFDSEGTAFVLNLSTIYA